jgi:hypothetical protein
LLVLSQPPQNIVISTEGGAFAAAVERPLYFAFALAVACSPHPAPKTKLGDCLLTSLARHFTTTTPPNTTSSTQKPSKSPKPPHPKKTQKP